MKLKLIVLSMAVGCAATGAQRPLIGGGAAQDPATMRNLTNRAGTNSLRSTTNRFGTNASGFTNGAGFGTNDVGINAPTFTNRFGTNGPGLTPARPVPPDVAPPPNPVPAFPAPPNPLPPPTPVPPSQPVPNPVPPSQPVPNPVPPSQPAPRVR